MAGIWLACFARCQAAPAVLDKPQNAAGTTRVIEAGDPGGDTGWWPQVRFDADDRAHIAYCDAHLGHVRYGVEASGGFSLETVVDHGNIGKYLSLALRPGGGVGLTYYNQSTRYFEYASRMPNEASWHIEHIAWGLEVGMASALRYDAKGQAHVLYYMPSGKLIAARRAPGAGATWQKTQLGDYQAVYSARIGALQHPDGVLFSFVDWQMDAAKLYLGGLDAAGWQQSLIPTARGAGWRSALAQVGQDLWVVHSDTQTDNTALSFRDKDAQWHHLMLVRGGSSFAVGAWHDRGVLAYAERSTHRRGLYLTQQPRKGLWPVECLTTSVGNDPDVAMAIDSRGRVLLVYYDLSIHGLKSYTTQLQD